MVEFLRKMTEWMLEKEDELAKKCAIDPRIIEQQIEKIEAKKEELHHKCQENEEELEHILTRLKWLKAEAEKCDTRQNEKTGGA
jgi:argininosuccinate lyase